MKKLFIIMFACIFLASGCVWANGRDKDRLDEGTVLADAHYKIAKEKIDAGEKVPDDVLLHWLDTHRKLFAFIVGATEGKTAEEVLQELERDEP